MSLNLAKLEKVRHLPNGAIEARCPACAEAGHDRKGEHLFIKADGRFGCCANPRDSAHRRRIFALAGHTSSQPVKVRPRLVKRSGALIKSGILGRLGRGCLSSSARTAGPDAMDQREGTWSGGKEAEGGVRTPRTGAQKSIEGSKSDSRTPRTLFSNSRAMVNEDVFPKLDGVGAGASEASELRLAHDSESDVAGLRLPYLTPEGSLVIPFDSPARFHWWKGGQSVAATLAEVRRWIRDTGGSQHVN